MIWPAHHRCCHCGKPAVWECIMAHIVGDVHSIVWLGDDPTTMLHLDCVKDYLEANPLEWDEDGNLINVYDPRHSSNQ